MAAPNRAGLFDIFKLRKKTYMKHAPRIDIRITWLDQAALNGINKKGRFNTWKGADWTFPKSG